jgi:hypothetical protein
MLRGDEDIEVLVNYVLANPVRKGLVDNWRGYPFAGSLVFELGEDGGGQAPALPDGGTIAEPARSRVEPRDHRGSDDSL